MCSVGVTVDRCWGVMNKCGAVGYLEKGGVFFSNEKVAPYGVLSGTSGLDRTSGVRPGCWVIASRAGFPVGLQ